MIARLSAFFSWGLLACCAAFWLLQFGARPLAQPQQALAVSERGPVQSDLSRLLGVTPAEAPVEAAPTQSRYELLGVVAAKSEAARNAGEGLALISVDGQPRTVRVGAPLEPGLHLLAVDARSATIGGDGRPSQTLQIVPPAAPATGQLQPAQASPTVLGGTPPQLQTVDPQAAPPLQVMPGGPRPPQAPPTQRPGGRSPTER
ncbi:hypothetical protein [Pelomonas sp. SE-A7]|uniref:hypothetical protein n=1 Tax=Pelomonas sp. SE-A7 TaxID=3054953 RepID=UPI00259C8EF3|nr:hypothetical protein [Pelomonas sp. SE-A7]MDM4766421.1 hypothetical protein [Pelomonas sp. SE-A7]